jgi:hypothetical protein
MDTSKWNRDNILRWILERDSRGEPVRAKDALAYNAYMHREAIRSFGSWAIALAAAGINLRVRRGRRTWSPKKVIRAIRRASVKPESLCYRNMQIRRGGLLSTAKQLFGSWRKALIAAGIDPESVRLSRRWDRESVIEAILDRAVRNEPLAVTKVSPSSLGKWGIRLFGSWENALRAAGLNPDQYVRARAPSAVIDTDIQSGANPPSGVQQQKWSRDRIASELRQRVQDGKAVNPAHLRIEDYRLYSAIRRYFSSWSAALLHAGFDPEKYRGRRGGVTGVGT